MSRFIAIDADAGGLFVVAGSARGHAVRVEAALPVLDDPRPLTEQSAPDLAKRLKEALSAARVTAAPVLLCVGRDRVVLKDVRHPKTAPTEEPAVVRFQAQRELAEPADNLHLDYVPLPTPPGADDRRATAVFVRKELFNAARTLCEQAGLKLAGFTPRPYASAAAVRRAVAAGEVPPPENPTAPVGVFSLWDGGGEFAVYRGEHLVFSRSVSGLALQSEAALVGEAKRSLAAFAAQSPGDKLDAVYLSEGHGTGGSWSARLEQSLPVPVHAFDPLAGSPAADALPPHLRGRFTAAAGLLAARAAGPLPINFVAPRQPRAEPSKARSWVLLGVLLVLTLAAGIGGGVYFLNSALDRRLAAADTDLKQVKKEIAEAELTKRKLDAIDKFRERSVNWLDLYYEITEAAPDNKRMKLKEFEGSILPPKEEAKPAAGGGQGANTASAAKPPVAGGKAAPGVTAKKDAAAADPVGKLQLVFLTSESDDGLPQKLVEVFAQEKQFFARPDPKSGQPSGGKRETTIDVDVLPRKPTQYTRKLVAKFPEQPKQPADQPPAQVPFWEEFP